MHIILFDTDLREALLPFTYTRPVCELRIGILTIREKWQIMLSTTSVSYITTEHLEPIYPIQIHDDNILLNGALLPNQDFISVLQTLKTGEALMMQGELIAARLSRQSFEKLLVKQDLEDLVGYEVEPSMVNLLETITSITELSKDQISADMILLDQINHLPEGIEVLGKHPVFIHPEAVVERAYIHAGDGPVYIGPDALVMDGARLRGPVSIGAGSIVKSHAYFSKGVCIGPACEVGGEIKQSVFLGHSNKSHEGYVGDSVIGEWCNLGALTTNSNLRNSFTDIKVWNYTNGVTEPTGKRKCGFFMGDYSRTAILTQMNAGTVIGVSCHIYGQGTIPAFLPSFTWGGADSMAEYQLEKALEAILVFRSFKDTETDDDVKTAISAIFELTAQYRLAHSS
jgi:UDP-N-acetylglucosamine diphosphorylase/glucosamine-1-phosphate N-acetyltransferase